MNNQMSQIHYRKSYEDGNFVGIKYNKENITINLPIGFDASLFQEMNDKDKKLNILLLLRSISLVNSNNSSTTEFDESDGKSQEIPFNSFLWIMSDYINNGIFQDIEKEYKQKINSGKINWKKTLNTEHFFTDDSVVFTNPYYETKQQTNNIITELNIYCINKSIEYIGFLFGNIKKLESNLTDEIVKKHEKYYIDILNKELLKSFNDRKKLLLNHMKRIISISYSFDSEIDLNYGTRRYEYAWEAMVNSTFGTKSINISDYFPEAYWTLFNNDRKKDLSKLRPDSILKDEKNNKIYILDAKYYKFGITKKISDLPHTDSIQKQITYGDHILTNREKYGNIDSNNIYNAFIIPYDKYDEDNKDYNLSHNIEYCGFAESDWKEHNLKHSYEKVSLILVDFKYLLNCYYKKDKTDYERLMSLIEKSNNML